MRTMELYTLLVFMENASFFIQFVQGHVIFQNNLPPLSDDPVVEVKEKMALLSNWRKRLTQEFLVSSDIILQQARPKQGSQRVSLGVDEMSEKSPMPLFILFDSKTGYLYGHLLASGPDDPFLTEMINWWSAHCSSAPLGLDYPGLVGGLQSQNTLSSN